MIVSSWRRWSKTSISVGDHQRHVGQAERVGVRLAERLDRADQVVAEEADGAAGERRQALDRRRPVAARRARDGGVGVGRGLAVGSAPRSRRLRSTREHAVAPAQHRARAEADEGVAADLALLGRLEQEAGRALGLAGAQLEEGGDRRLAVVDEAARGPGPRCPRAASSRACSRLGSSRSSRVSRDGHSAPPSPPTAGPRARPAGRSRW